MLERAVRCLDSRASDSRRTSRKVLQSRRQLHTAFWHHAATELDLPAYCLYSLSRLFEPPHPSESTTSSRPDNKTPFLDFLYPPQVKALLRQTRPDRRRWRRAELAPGSQSVPRTFTSLAQTRQRTQTAVLEREEVQELTEARPRTSVSRPARVRAPQVHDDLDVPPVDAASVERLQAILSNKFRKPPDRLASDAWKFYNKLADPNVKARFSARVAQLLQQSGRPMDELRASQIFETMPQGTETFSLAANVVFGLIKAGETERAAATHDGLLSWKSLKDPAFRVSTTLIIKLLEDKRWDLMLGSYSARRSLHRSRKLFENQYFEWRLSLERRLKNLPGYDVTVYEMLDHFLAAGQGLDVAREMLHSLIHTFVGALFETDHHPQTYLDILLKVRELGIKEFPLHRQAIDGILRQGDVSPNVKLAAALQCYRLLREEGHRPTRELVRNILYESVKANSGMMISHFVTEWDKIFGEADLRVSLSNMIYNARRGNVKLCEREIEKCRPLIARRDKESTQTHGGANLFYPLLHAESITAGPEGVQRRIKWIADRFNLHADVHFWNILLGAHANFDDFEGAERTMFDMREAGIDPNESTISAMLALCARRGDSQLAQSYLSLSRDRKISMTPSMIGRLVLAVINDNKLDYAIRITKDMSRRDPQAMTNSWTQVLAALALRTDLTRASEAAETMRKLDVPFDGPAYAALMRVFAAYGRPDMALKVMSDSMRADRVRPSAIHYAVLINGYADARRFESGLRAYAQWLKDSQRLRLPDSLSVRVALLKLQGMAARQSIQLQADGKESGVLQSGVLEELAQELLEELEQGGILGESLTATLSANGQPQMLLGDLTPAGALPSVYFDALFSVYGLEQAMDKTKRLLRVLEERTSSTMHAGPWRWSLKALLAMMQTRYTSGDHEAVSRIYATAFETLQQRTTKSAASSRETAKTKSVRSTPRLTQQMLAYHLSVQLRNLADQGDVKGMQETMTAYAGAGFLADNFAWNLYVQLLVRHGELREAFSKTERKLMHGFSRTRPEYIVGARTNSTEASTPVGHSFKRIRGSRRYVTVQTMEILAEALRGLSDGATREVLVKEAPRTVAAAREFPLEAVAAGETVEAV